MAGEYAGRGLRLSEDVQPLNVLRGIVQVKHLVCGGQRNPVRAEVVLPGRVAVASDATTTGRAVHFF